MQKCSRYQDIGTIRSLGLQKLYGLSFQEFPARPAWTFRDGGKFGNLEDFRFRRGRRGEEEKFVGPGGWGVYQKATAGVESSERVFRVHSRLSVRNGTVVVLDGWLGSGGRRIRGRGTPIGSQGDAPESMRRKGERLRKTGRKRASAVKLLARRC